jgi:ParB-like chromosome segregation protein Spo0J
MSENGIRPTVVVPVDKLRPHPRNYQSHPADQLDQLARSIELHGVFRNIVVARGNVILAGHGVVLALRRMGWDRVPAVQLDIDPLSPKALHVLAADNEIANLADVDDRALTELLRDLADDDVDLLFGTGYDDEKLTALLLATRTRAEIPDFDAAAEWVGLPGYEQEAVEPQLLVRFDSPEDRDKLMEMMGCETPHHRRKTNDRWSVWWPDRKRNDPAAVRFEP